METNSPTEEKKATAQAPPRIAEPVALVHYVIPSRAGPYRNVTTALGALEQTQFPPGTPANDLYQIALVSWRSMTLAVTVFPGSHLLAFAETLRPLELALVRGAPTLFAPARPPDFFDTAAEVRRMFGLDVADRAYTFEALGSGGVLREGVPLGELTGASPGQHGTPQ